jgi:hypothetical protein
VVGDCRRSGQGVGVVLVAALQAQGIGLLVEGDDVLVAVARHDHQPVQGVDPLGADQVAL